MKMVMINHSTSPGGQVLRSSLYFHFCAHMYVFIAIYDYIYIYRALNLYQCELPDVSSMDFWVIKSGWFNYSESVRLNTDYRLLNKEKVV